MTNVITRLSGKQLLENGECGVRNSPQSIKRRKVNAIRQFPTNCGSIAHRVHERHNAGEYLVVTDAEKLKAGSSKLPIELSVESLPDELKSEAVKKPLESHGKAPLENVEMRSLSAQGEVEVNSLANNNAMPNCGSVAHRVRERHNEGESVVVKPTEKEKLKAGSSKLPIELSVASLPYELNSEYVKKPLEWYGKALKENVEMGSPSVQGEVELNSLANNNATGKQIDIHCSSGTSSRICLRPRKYPTPKIRKGVTIFRDFPRGCGRRNLDLSSKCEAFPPGKSSKENQRISETDNEQIRGGGCDDGRNILQDIDVEVEVETLKGTDVEKFELLEQTCQFNQEAGIESISITSSPQSNSLQANLSLKACDNNEDGAKRWVEERIGSDSEEYIRYESSDVNTGVLMPSVMIEGSDIAHSDVGIVSATQPGVEVSDCAASSSTDGYADQRYELMGTNGSNYLLLKHNNVKSLVLGDAVSDDRWKGNGTHSAKESIDLTVCSLNDDHEALSRNKVREVLDLFEKILLEERLREEQLDKKSKGKKKLSSYVYVEVAMQLKRQEKWIYMNERVLGAVPGIEVGDQFHYRAELVIVGLHIQFVAGIDYMEKDGKKIATSIVSSGRYSTDKEFEDVLIYCGEGGNQAIADQSSKDQALARDQTLARGNLALKNSMDEGTPVRVIRGRRSCKPKETTFTYDGLYIVSNCWKERAQNGKQVYMFQFNKIQGQPKLYLDKVHSVGKSKSRRCQTLIDDISYGKEKIPIRVVNNIDNDKPPTFSYITHMVYPQQESSTITNGCHCVDGCSDYVQCSCVVKNQGMVPFNENGAIVRAKPFVYECGPSCGCPPSCHNRVTQHGLKFQLEVFKTKMRGWGVRSRNFISSGSFICEYVGELLNDTQAEERIGFDEYLFDIGGEDGFAIDAAQFGNIGRFVNHSCSPNLYAQDVLFDHDDKMMPHVMLFATRNIPPLQELTYDYNYKIDHVYDSNGNVKRKTCRCGARNCTGRMY